VGGQVVRSARPRTWGPRADGLPHGRNAAIELATQIGSCDLRQRRAREVHVRIDETGTEITAVQRNHLRLVGQHDIRGPSHRRDALPSNDDRGVHNRRCARDSDQGGSQVCRGCGRRGFGCSVCEPTDAREGEREQNGRW
jgi:hypothetical protein